ncbi:ECF transporter S component, folate family [Tindallia magadiensis]|uniref:ECF transporter S component, folate family n=1 Tax=Tindallia magadiensis TaxID=69895 RepID=A0A1I3HJC9_9FIRM|nr:folate family ECF transporter S component [Tindallia magadiensis]SFI35782.1 ECF transporter S component, folate family [Tindallia magadiensis]
MFGLSSGRISTKVLVMASFFVGINIILSRIGAVMLFNNSVRMSFGNVPLIISGILLGPFAGLMTGIVSDLLGFLINSHGAAFHPGFTISSGLTGFIPGMVVLVAGRFGFQKFSLVSVVASNVLVYILISGLLNTVWLTHLLGTGFWVLFPARLASHGIVTIVNTMLVYAVVKSFQKTNVVPSVLQS